MNWFTIIGLSAVWFAITILLSHAIDRLWPLLEERSTLIAFAITTVAFIIVPVAFVLHGNPACCFRN